MSAATTHTSGTQQPSRAQVGEWFWRFLAVVMLVVIGWVVWIAIQISPPDMVLPAAYEAAAQGRARNSAGAIGGVAGGATVQAPADPKDATGRAAAIAAPPAAPVPPAPAATPAEPPVNLEKLRFAESIETPIFERPRRAARPAPDALK